MGEQVERWESLKEAAMGMDGGVKKTYWFRNQKGVGMGTAVSQVRKNKREWWRGKKLKKEKSGKKKRK
jgi:hypothetical protein